MKKLLIIILCALSTVGMSQNIDSVITKTNKVKWVNSAQMGLLFDTNDRQGTAGRISTSYLSGVSYGKWRGMLGVGVSDYYNYIVVPVFLEIQYDILKATNTPFVYANGGKGMTIIENSSYERSVDGGINAGLGIGYKWKLGGVDLFIKSGYHVQKIKSVRNNIYYDYWYVNNFAPTPAPAYEVTRKMRRASISIGINF